MKKTDHPPVFGEHTRSVRRIMAEELIGRNDSVGVKGGYGIYRDETIVFPDRLEDFEVFLQPISFNSDLCQTHISVLRNGSPSYISLGCLYRIKGAGLISRYTCEFGRRLGIMKDDYERVLLLVGNRIRCERIEEDVFVKRDPATGREIRPLETYTAKYGVIDYDGVNVATLIGLLNSRVFQDKGNPGLATGDGVDVDEDGFWPFGRPLKRIYKASIDGIAHIALDPFPLGTEITDDVKPPTASDLRRLLDSSDAGTPVELFYHRPHLHDVVICPITEIIPNLYENSIWFESGSHSMEVDEEHVIKES